MRYFRFFDIFVWYYLQNLLPNYFDFQNLVLGFWCSGFWGFGVWGFGVLVVQSMRPKAFGVLGVWVLVETAGGLYLDTSNAWFLPTATQICRWIPSYALMTDIRHLHYIRIGPDSHWYNIMGFWEAVVRG